MADVALVDIGSLDLDAGQRLGLDEDGSQGMAVIGASMEGLGVEHELAAGGFGALVVVIETLQPNSWGLCALPLAMHSTSGACKLCCKERECSRKWSAASSRLI